MDGDISIYENEIFAIWFQALLNINKIKQLCSTYGFSDSSRNEELLFQLRDIYGIIKYKNG